VPFANEFPYIFSSPLLFFFDEIEDRAGQIVPAGPFVAS